MAQGKRSVIAVRVRRAGVGSGSGMGDGTRAALGRYLAVALLLRSADEGMRVVLVLLALERTGGVALGGLLLGAWFAPHVLAAPLAGGITDRAVAAGHPRLPYAGAFTLIGAVLLAATAGIGRVPTVAVLAVLVLGGCAGPLATGGLTSLLPRFLPPAGSGRASASTPRPTAPPGWPVRRSRRCWPTRPGRPWPGS
jgi:hypothetical protein